MSYTANTSGQYLYFTLSSASDGSAITAGTVNGFRTIDGGSQTAVTGTISHKGNGQWQLALSTADINGSNIGFLFTHASAVNVSINIVTDSEAAATEAKQDTIIGYVDALETRLTDGRAALLDNLDAAVSSRLASGSYTAPDNASITSVLADTDFLQQLLAELITGSSPNRKFTTAALENGPAGGGGGGDATEAKQDTIIGYVDALETRLTDGRAALLDNLDAAVSSRLASGSYTAPDNASITSVLADTDFLQQLLAELITGSSPNRKFTTAALENGPAGGGGGGLSLSTVYEGAETLQDYLRISRAVLFGLSTGGGTETNYFRDLADSKNRVSATVDPETGNRTAVTVDAS